MKKFLTIALLVMALCVVSVAVSAEIKADYNATSTVATVTAPTVNAGQAVILVVEGAEKETTDLTITDDYTTEDLAADIVYVDQATVAANSSVTFNFIPRVGSEKKDTTVFYSDGVNDVQTADLYNGAKYTVTLDVNGGTHYLLAQLLLTN